MKIKLAFLFLSLLGFLLSSFNSTQNNNRASINCDSLRIDSTSGFIIAEGMEMVQAHCTGCHSNKLVTQYRATRENWLDRIRWMQKNHNLWELGESELIILDYLAKNYPPRPVQSNRRTPLKNIQWYRLNE